MTAEFDPGFSTPAASVLFSAASRVEAMCRVEAAHAAALAEVGIIPAQAADEISAACREPIEDPEAVLAEGWDAGTPVIPLLDRLRRRLSPEAAAAIHLGATTQDIVDTSLMLLMRDGCRLLGADLRQIAEDLRTLAVEHRATVMIGRTFLQRAMPTTFGLRAAEWLDPMLRAIEELEVCCARLPVQLGGPVGVPAEYGEAAGEVTERLATSLGLTVPRLPWHGDRWVVADSVAFMERVAHAVAKIALDLALLSQSEIGEVSIRSGGSSSMPGKRNPIDAARAIAAAEACSGTASIVTGGRPHELERAVGGWHAEWFAVPVTFQAACAAVAATAGAVASIEIDAERMAAAAGDVPSATVAAAGELIDRVVAAADSILGARD